MVWFLSIIPILQKLCHCTWVRDISFLSYTLLFEYRSFSLQRIPSCRAAQRASLGAASSQSAKRVASLLPLMVQTTYEILQEMQMHPLTIGGGDCKVHIKL